MWLSWECAIGRYIMGLYIYIYSKSYVYIYTYIKIYVCYFVKPKIILVCLKMDEHGVYRQFVIILSGKIMTSLSMECGTLFSDKPKRIVWWDLQLDRLEYHRM